jgi:hypothetical protein
VLVSGYEPESVTAIAAETVPDPGFAMPALTISSLFNT